MQEALQIFFGDTAGTTFNLFGVLYFILLFSVLIVAVLMWRFRTKLRSTADKTKKVIRYSAAALLFANMTVYYLSLMLTGQYSIKKHLPLEFCFITGYILMYLLITNNKNGIYETLFYCTIIGPLPAMLFPNLSGSFDRFIFYQFIISHHIMMLISFYCIIVLQYKISVKGAFKAFLYGNAVFIAVSILNHFWGSNYIMQGKLPDHIIELFPFIKYFNSPFFWLEVCGLIMIFLGIQLGKFLGKENGTVQSAPLFKHISNAGIGENINPNTKTAVTKQ